MGVSIFMGFCLRNHPWGYPHNLGNLHWGRVWGILAKKLLLGVHRDWRARLAANGQTFRCWRDPTIGEGWRLEVGPWLEKNRKSPGFTEPYLEVDESWCALPKPFASFCTAPHLFSEKGCNALPFGSESNAFGEQNVGRNSYRFTFVNGGSVRVSHLGRRTEMAMQALSAILAALPWFHHWADSVGNGRMRRRNMMKNPFRGLQSIGVPRFIIHLYTDGIFHEINHP